MALLVYLQLLLITLTSAQVWVPHGDHEYWISTSNITWHDANTSCHEMEASLTSITSEEENSFVLEQTTSTTIYWIGLTLDSPCGGACDQLDVSNEDCDPVNNNNAGAEQCCNCRNRWRWVDGGDMVFRNWQPAEPTGGNVCGRIEFQQWTDFICDTEHLYICKRVIEDRETANSQPTTPNTPSNTEENSKEPNKPNGSDDQGLVIGIAVAVVLAVIIIVVIIVVCICLRRKKQMKENNPADKYNAESPYKSDPNHNSTPEEQDGGYYNVGAVTSPQPTPTYEDPGTSYAQIAIPPMKPKPKPTGPKPTHLVNNEPNNAAMDYADIEFASSSQPNEPSDGVYDSGSLAYASIDTLNRSRELSYDTGINEYAMTGDTTSPNMTSPPSHNVTGSGSNVPLNSVDLQAMYAQPMKNKKTKAKVTHMPAPSNDAVLYAVPDKK